MAVAPYPSDDAKRADPVCSGGNQVGTREA